MKYIVGDIHGKLEVVNFFMDNFSSKDLIFVGDILDSFDRSIEDQITCLQLIHKSEATLLMGNHELSYISHRHRCSGFKAGTDVYIHQNNWVRDLPKYIWVGDVLVSHAGLSRKWFGEKSPSISEVQTFLENMSEDAMFAIGQGRGGWSPVGGLLWDDFREHVPINGLTQVFGHTRGNGIRVKKEGPSYCIDCLEDSDKIQFVAIENNQVYNICTVKK